MGLDDVTASGIHFDFPFRSFVVYDVDLVGRIAIGFNLVFNLLDRARVQVSYGLTRLLLADLDVLLEQRVVSRSRLLLDLIDVAVIGLAHELPFPAFESRASISKLGSPFWLTRKYSTLTKSLVCLISWTCSKQSPNSSVSAVAEAAAKTPKVRQAASSRACRRLNENTVFIPNLHRG